MPEALGDFDPKLTYDDASSDYEDASRDFWQYLSTRTVDRLGAKRGERVLDVPCGTGPALVPLAERVGPSGRVVGIDYAERMLEIARQKLRSRGLTNVDLEVGDMTAITSREPFDAVLCVLGLFFVDDMPGLVRSLRDLARPGGGRVAVTVFGEHFFDPMRDAFVAAVREVAPALQVIEPWRRTEDESVLRAVFGDAGIEDVTVETNDDHLPLRSADDWWRIVMGSGLRRTVAALGPEAAARVRRLCDAYVAEHGVRTVLTRSRYALAVRP